MKTKFILPCLGSVSLLGTLNLSSCLIKGKTSATSVKESSTPPDIRTSNLIKGDPTTTVYESVLYNYRPDSLVSGSTVHAENLPSWMSIDKTTGVLRGIALGHENIDNIKLIAKNGTNYTTIGPFSLTIRGDILFPQQWYFRNTGQAAYSAAGGVAGIDLNLSETFSRRIIGLGSSIAVSDTGLETNHPDLIENMHTGNHKNYNTAAPYFGDPRNTKLDGDHGTSVAGIIVASGWNSIGGRGVAPGAVVAGLNYLNSDQTTEKFYDQASGGYSIFNYSYGASFVPFSGTYDANYSDVVQDQFINGRQGLGAIYIKSAGNSYQECDIFDANLYTIDDGSSYHCFPHNANADPENAMTSMIVVGAINAKGQKSSYSSTGSCLWVSSFGGEFGRDAPAIVTTDQQGCHYGFSRAVLSAATDFQKGEIADNENCDYTQTFNGTSAAAPMISGIVALLLEVNPKLTARDVKHILATTSRVVNDSSFTQLFPFNYSNLFQLEGYTYEQDWVTNKAGYHFHNHFGFGLVDGDAAVAMAESYNTNSWGPQLQTNQNFADTSYQVTSGQSIPDNSTTGRTSTFTMTDSLTMEAVQIKVNITHGRPGDLALELTSPSGTKSILLNAFNSFLMPYSISDAPVWVADLSDFVLLSNAFYGENSQGQWTLKVIDALGGATGTQWDDASSQTGTLDNWSINVVGH